jgi:hypothetical protein
VGAAEPVQPTKSSKKPRKGGERAEGNADGDGRQEAGKGSDREEDSI